MELLHSIEAAERALRAGSPEEARGHLELAIALGIPDDLILRFVAVFAQTNRFISRHRDTLAWLDSRLAQASDPPLRAVLLRARIGALRQVDTGAVLDLAGEALDAARAVGDHESFASVLAHASFSAYRRGDVRRARRFAELAAEREFPTLAGRIDGLRAQMFAATAADDHEVTVGLSRRIRDGLLELADLGGAANECNNIAEALLLIGLPADAREEAADGAEMAVRSGHRAVELYAHVLVGRAVAETGDVGGGIAQLPPPDPQGGNPPLTVDIAAIRAYWLLERGAAGDAAEARDLATRAVDLSRVAGIAHVRTTLHATGARALLRLGDEAGAREEVARARDASDAADGASALHLALAMAEVLKEGDPARRTAIATARARLLRDAGRRENPWAFCTSVKLHRSLLELSGGVPPDLPRGT